MSHAARRLHSLAPTLVALPSMSLIPSTPLSVATALRAVHSSAVVSNSKQRPATGRWLQLWANGIRVKFGLRVRLASFVVATDRRRRRCRGLSCISLTPARLDRYLAALPAMSLIPQLHSRGARLRSHRARGGSIEIFLLRARRGFAHFRVPLAATLMGCNSTASSASICLTLGRLD